MNSLYWHDYETWGANPMQDRPCQFAGVRTNEALEIIGSPLVCYCRPTPDLLPSPQASLITGITPQKARSEGLSEPEFIALIHEQLSAPGTCGVGYNSLRFDDEVTRLCLYRNFYDPFEREWRDGNSRWDIIDMVRLVYALRPETLTWPMDDGVPSFRLERLTQMNGIGHDAAHDALSDVYATLALARLIKQRQPELYEYVYALRHKERVAALVDVASAKPLLHISSKYPSKQGCAAVVMPLIHHPRFKHRAIVYDLSADPEPLISLDPEEIAKRLFVKNEDLPSDSVRIPLKEVHYNRSPVLTTIKLLTPEHADRLTINLAQCERHWLHLKAARDVLSKVAQVYRDQPAFEAATDPEQQIYQGFLNDRDKALLPQVRAAAPERLAEFAKHFSDPRLQVLLFRYRARHFPQTLSVTEQQEWQEWYYRRLTDPDAGAAMVLDDYFSELDALGEDAPEDWLNDMYHYGDELLTS